MRVSELVEKLEQFNGKHGDCIVRYGIELDGHEQDFRVDDMIPVNINTAAAPVWCCMLSD